MANTLRITSELVQRILIECPMADKPVALDYVDPEHFRVLRSGPKRIELTRIMPDIYSLVAERVYEIPDVPLSEEQMRLIDEELAKTQQRIIAIIESPITGSI